MNRGRVVVTLTVAALAGDRAPVRAVAELVRPGLETLLGLRKSVEHIIITDPRRPVVRVGLPYGARLLLPLYRRPGGSGLIPIACLRLRTGKETRFQHPNEECCIEIAERIAGSPTAVCRVLEGIERARLRLLRLVEEGSRWQ